jgi:hypothetical protein
MLPDQRMERGRRPTEKRRSLWEQFVNKTPGPNASNPVLAAASLVEPARFWRKRVELETRRLGLQARISDCSTLNENGTVRRGVRLPPSAPLYFPMRRSL